MSVSEEYLLHQEILKSKGMIFQNRMKLFSFSLNIFYGNFIELTSEFRKIEDPEMGFFLVQEKNRDKWDQQHREINRRIHNFLTSAFTLVDHTRNFIKNIIICQVYNEDINRKLILK